MSFVRRSKLRRLFLLVSVCGTLLCFILGGTYQSSRHQYVSVSTNWHGNSTGSAVIPTESTQNDTSTQQIVKYFKEEKLRCIKRQKNAIKLRNLTPIPYCPCIPPGLNGRLKINMTDDPDGWEGVLRDIVSSSNSVEAMRVSFGAANRVLVGGEWSPTECRANTRLAVIIPCRDRESHLRILLRHLYPVLQRQLAHFRIFVVEQNSPAVFNKAAMMNIGFMEAVKRFPQLNCVLFQDVDNLLEDDRTLMTCSDRPHHYAVAMDEWKYRMIYGGLFGGVVSMTPEIFRKVNGYSTSFFGWGGEDDDMGKRVRRFAAVFRPPMLISRYSTIKHRNDEANPRNELRHRLMASLSKKYANKTFDGLSDMNYELNDVQLRPLYTWIHANLNVTNSTTYPDHRTNSYRKLVGTSCRQKGSSHVTSGYDVSWTTCRYICDSELRRPCVGFTYRRPTPTAINRTAALTVHPTYRSALDGDQDLFASFGRRKHSYSLRPAITTTTTCIILSTVCELTEGDANDENVDTFIKLTDHLMANATLT